MRMCQYFPHSVRFEHIAHYFAYSMKMPVTPPKALPLPMPLATTSNTSEISAGVTQHAPATVVLHTHSTHSHNSDSGFESDQQSNEQVGTIYSL